MSSARAALDRLCDPAAEVSAHYLIGQDGTLWQMVEDQHRAWHAGAGSWQGQGDVNSRSIGIELDNTGQVPFPEPLMATLEPLLGAVMARWRIPPTGVIGHSDMAPGRKSDPGARFDWGRLARQGLASRTPSGAGPTPTDAKAFRALACAAGYPGDVADDALLQALRLRHRPWATGPLDQTDMALVAALPQLWNVAHF